jgi:hypothetical protein
MIEFMLPKSVLYKRKGTLIMFLLCAFFAACQQHPEDMLTSRKHKYWDVYESARGRTGSYRLGQSGTCYWFLYPRNKEKRILFDFGDVLPTYSWQMLSVDTLELMGLRYKISELSDDTIRVMKGENGMLLVKSIDQSDGSYFLIE